jgi:hypothetical protein
VIYEAGWSIQELGSEELVEQVTHTALLYVFKRGLDNWLLTCIFKTRSGSRKGVGRTRSR